MASSEESTSGVSLSQPDFWISPERESGFAALRQNHPISWQPELVTAWSDGGRGYWAVVTHSGVRAVSRDAKRFVSGRGTELFELPLDAVEAFSGMLNMDGARHAQMRSVVSGAFSPRYIAQLEPMIQAEADRIIDAVVERGECDFVSEIAEPFPTAVICEMMGIPESDRREIARLSRIAVPLGDAEYGSFDDALQAVLDLIEYAKELGRERQKHPREDLTTTLVMADAGGEHLTAEEMGTFFELLVTAGIETTAASIAHGMLALSEHPDQRTLLFGDYEHMAPHAVEEMLRWSTPVIHFRRTAIEDLELDGTAISAGDKVLMFYNSANRDERVFDAPDKFDITRNPNPHVTFGGGGLHFCLGAHLARLEMRVLFKTLQERLGTVEITGEPVLMHSMFFNGIKAMPCEFTPGAPVG